MIEGNDQVNRTSHESSLTMLMLIAVVGAVGVLSVLALLASQGRMASQEMNRVGPLAIALAVAAVLVALALVAKAILTIFPRRSGAGRGPGRRGRAAARAVAH